MSEPQELIERAFQKVHALCRGDEKWTMRVPVDEDRDSDTVICAGLKAGKEALTRIAELEAEHRENRSTIAHLQAQIREGREKAKSLEALIASLDKDSMGWSEEGWTYQSEALHHLAAWLKATEGVQDVE